MENIFYAGIVLLIFFEIITAFQPYRYRTMVATLLAWGKLDKKQSFNTDVGNGCLLTSITFIIQVTGLFSSQWVFIMTEMFFSFVFTKLFGQDGVLPGWMYVPRCIISAGIFSLVLYNKFYLNQTSVEFVLNIF